MIKSSLSVDDSRREQARISGVSSGEISATQEPPTHVGACFVNQFKPVNAGFGNARRAVALLILDYLCLWYFIAGGRLGCSLLLLAGLVSLSLLPHRYSARVVAQHKGMVVLAGMLTALAYALSPSFLESAFPSLVILVVFALGCGAVSGFLATALARREWVFLAVVALAVVLAGWAVIFATVIMPQNTLVTAETGGASGEIETMFGVFSIGNNYYTLTYYLLVPIATASLVFGEGFTRKSLVLLLAGLVTLVLAFIFGRRGPVLVGAITCVFAAICARRPGRWSLRTVSVAGVVLVCLVGCFAWLQSREWGANVIENYLINSENLLEDDRFGLWWAGAHCITEHPLGGGRAFFQTTSQYAHNVLLDAGLDCGVPGLLVFTLLLGQIAWRAVARMLRRYRQLDGLEICLFAIVLSHFLISMQEPYLAERFILLLWAWVTLSCVTEGGTKVSLKRIQPYSPRFIL